MDLRLTLSNIFKEIVQTALISLGIFFFVYIFLVQPHRVKGESMVPNFKDGELLLTEKVSYRLYKPERGDVIVFQAPDRKVDFIKRVIGLPGETVEVENGEIFINKEKLEEPYIAQPTEGDMEVTVGVGEYFVLGDNRGASSDSRVFGVVKKKSIKGKAWVVYWPIFETKNSTGARTISKIQYSITDPLK
ncbi:signal peptidase I [Candidatus Curtissbacteria bacterium]|nr:signal peptidase I [Candidatus Curtissbacteria bacterium]